MVQDYYVGSVLSSTSRLLCHAGGKEVSSMESVGVLCHAKFLREFLGILKQKSATHNTQGFQRFNSYSEEYELKSCTGYLRKTGPGISFIVSNCDTYRSLQLS